MKSASVRIQKSALLSVHLAVFLFGLSALFGRWLGLPAVIIVLGRTLFGIMALLALIVVVHEKIRAKSVRDYALLLGSGIVLAFHWTAFFQSVQTGNVALPR